MNKKTAWSAIPGSFLLFGLFFQASNFGFQGSDSGFSLKLGSFSPNCNLSMGRN
jgi:hypothetical protein